MKHSVWCAHG